MATSPILLVPYMWIGDFVRCHSVIRLLKARNPGAPGRRPHHQHGRAAARLHAGRPQGHRRRSAAQAPGLRPASGAGGPAARGGLRPGPGDAAHLEGRAGAVSGRNSGAHRLCRRGPLRPAQRPALGRARAAPHDRPLRRARAAQGRQRSRRTGRCRNSRSLPPTSRPGGCGTGFRPTAARRWRWRRARSARPSGGRRPPTRRWRGRWRPKGTRSG